MEASIRIKALQEIPSGMLKGINNKELILCIINAIQTKKLPN